MLKRFFDLFFTVPGIIIIFPFFAIIALWIKIDSPGPVFYRQERLGKEGKMFKIYKFRTMVANADKIGGAITIGYDSRITRSGRFLRKYKLDELPQLFNVLIGEMSLVGPRPEVKKYVDMYNAEQRAVLDLLPGITDPASIKYRNESELLAARDYKSTAIDPEDAYINEIIPDKIKLNLEYAKRANLCEDFKVIIRTIFS